MFRFLPVRGSWRVAVGLAAVAALAAQTAPGLRIVVQDASGNPVAGARVTVTANGAAQPVARAETGANGEATPAGIGDGTYQVRVEALGMLPLSEEVRVAGAPVEVDFRLAAAGASSQTVTVAATADSGAAAGAAPPASVNHDSLSDLPNPTQQVAAALPLTPGVVRTSDGQVAVNGARENESAMLLNDADATDPATGNYSVNLPLEVVDEVQVYQAPYLGEYGQFTGGITKVETRGGTDDWQYDLNDFLPEPRFRSGSIFGIRGFTPVARIAGPLLRHRLYISEGFSYNLDKTPLRGLPFPGNLTTTEGEDSFTQLDWVADESDAVNVTVNFAPNHIRYAGLGVFQPQTASPDARYRNQAYTFAEHHATAGGALIDSRVEMEWFHTDLWPQGNVPMLLRSGGDGGNFFSTQHRTAHRLAWSADYAARSWRFLGQHQFKAGGGIAETASATGLAEAPVMVYRPDGSLSQAISFGGGLPLLARTLDWNAFVQDEWLAKPDLSLDLSARYQGQSIADGLHLAPRFGLAWSITPALTLRGGIGIFYNRLPLNIAAFSDYPTRTVASYDATGTQVVLERTYPYILTDFTQSPKQSRFLPGGNFNFLPYNDTWNTELERRFGRRVIASAEYMSSHTRRQFVVAPESDELGVRAITLSNSGNMRYQKLQFLTRVNWFKSQVVNLSYVHSSAHGDMNDFDTVLGDNPEPIIHRNEYAPLPYDTPNRLVAWGDFHMPMAVTFTPLFEVRTGFPYSVLDANFNYAGPADAQRYPRYSDLDFTLTKVTRVWGKYSARWGFDLYNATGHFNPTAVQANNADPRFGLFLANQYRYFEPELDLIW